MATIYDLKPGFQALLRPLCGALARAGVTANQVTVAAALLSVAGGGAILWPGWVVIVVVLALIAEAAGLLGPMIGASRRYDGPVGKSDRAFVFGFLAFLLGVGVSVGDGGWIEIALELTLLFSAVTVIKRARNALAEAEERAE